MNIKLASYSLIIAATCGLAFNSAARADEDENDGRPKAGNMRFQFEGTMIKGDHIGHRQYRAATSPSSVQSGGAPKNLLGLDPSFVSRPAPLPVAPAPRPVQQVAAKIMPSSPFSSLFGHPTTPQALVASAPQALPALQAPAAKFGKSAAPLAAPAMSATKSTSIAWKARPHVRPTALAARPASQPVAAYAPGMGYTGAPALPGYDIHSGNGSSSSVSGTVLNRHHR